MRTRWNAWVWAVAATALLAAAAEPAPSDALRKQALALNNITGEDAEFGKILELIEDPTHTKPLLAEAAKLAKEKEQPFNINATRILAQTAHLLRDTDASATFYRLFIAQAEQLRSTDKIGLGYSGLINTLFDGGKYEESDAACQAFLALKGDSLLQQMKPAVIRLRVLVLAKEGKEDKASELLQTLIKAQPENPANQITKAKMLRLLDKPADAITAYEEAIDLYKKDDDLSKEEKQEYADSIRYTLSGLYMDLNQVDKATADLKALLEKDPDNPGYNNDLGYIMADHDMNLDESEKLIRKALDEDKKQRQKANPEQKPGAVKDNPSYLDSLGWVLYKQKKYKEAREPLEEAVKQPDAQSIEIYDHLAEVLNALGDKDAAVTAWKKGLELPAETKREKEKKAEVEKKLKDSTSKTSN
jgi:tetratricopeptide (TPR) repeat protein